MNRPEVRLECGDTIRVPYSKAKREDVPILCARHGYSDIVLVHWLEWHHYCIDCNWSEWTGQNRYRGTGLRMRHVRRRHSHRIVSVYDRITPNGRGTARGGSVPATRVDTTGRLW
jgi:hypothetical protein